MRIQRELVLGDERHFSFEFAGRRTTYYTIDRTRSIVIHQWPKTPQESIELFVRNSDAEPWREEAVERTLPLATFENSDDGLRRANQYATDFILILGLEDEADGIADHVLNATRAHLKDVREKANQPNRTAV